MDNLVVCTGELALVGIHVFRVTEYGTLEYIPDVFDWGNVEFRA